jgi:hypothetical protein
MWRWRGRICEAETLYNINLAASFKCDREVITVKLCEVRLVRDEIVHIEMHLLKLMHFCKVIVLA